MLLSKEEKEQLVIKLAMEGKTIREIAKTAHISFVDIGKIIRRFTGDKAEYQSSSHSLTSKAFQMFKDGKNKVDVAIALNLSSEDVVTLFEDFMCLVNLDKLMTIYRELGNDTYLLHYLFHHLKWEGIATKDAISRFAAMAGRLTRLDEEELKICEQIGGLNDKKVELEREVESVTSLLRYLQAESSKLQ